MSTHKCDQTLTSNEIQRQEQQVWLYPSTACCFPSDLEAYIVSNTEMSIVQLASMQAFCHILYDIVECNTSII